MITFTPREREVAEQVAEGYANTEIAKRLFVDVKTVQHHLNQMYHKVEAEYGFAMPTHSQRVCLVREIFSRDGFRPSTFEIDTLIEEHKKLVAHIELLIEKFYEYQKHH
jgi:hypothetical protein